MSKAVSVSDLDFEYVVAQIRTALERRAMGPQPEAEVTRLGGMAKGYALIRYAKRQGIADARRFASPTARLLGSTVGN